MVVCVIRGIRWVELYTPTALPSGKESPVCLHIEWEGEWTREQMWNFGEDGIS